MALTFQTSSEDQTIALGIALGRILRAGDVLALDGELGAGKTRLVRGISEGMGLDPSQVSSPTYVLVHEYTRPLGGAAGGSVAATPLYHVDAYRLSGPDDVDSLGFERVIDGFGVVVVEWGERIAAALQGEPSFGRVRIQAEGPEQRRLDMVLPRSWAMRGQWRGLEALAVRPGETGGAAGGGALPAGWTRCPVTGKPVAPDSPTFPFVDAHARMADLGRWMLGTYTLSRELTAEDELDADLGTPERGGI